MQTFHTKFINFLIIFSWSIFSLSCKNNDTLIASVPQDPIESGIWKMTKVVDYFDNKETEANFYLNTCDHIQDTNWGFKKGVITVTPMRCQENSWSRSYNQTTYEIKDNKFYFDIKKNKDLATYAELSLTTNAMVWDIGDTVNVFGALIKRGRKYYFTKQ